MYISNGSNDYEKGLLISKTNRELSRDSAVPLSSTERFRVFQLIVLNFPASALPFGAFSLLLTESLPRQAAIFSSNCTKTYQAEPIHWCVDMSLCLHAGSAAPKRPNNQVPQTSTCFFFINIQPQKARVHLTFRWAEKHWRGWGFCALRDKVLHASCLYDNIYDRHCPYAVHYLLLNWERRMWAHDMISRRQK